MRPKIKPKANERSPKWEMGETRGKDGRLNESQRKEKENRKGDDRRPGKQRTRRFREGKGGKREIEGGRIAREDTQPEKKG